MSSFGPSFPPPTPRQENRKTGQVWGFINTHIKLGVELGRRGEAVSQERHPCVSNRNVIKVLHQNRFCLLLNFRQMNGIVPATGKLRIPICGPRTA